MPAYIVTPPAVTDVGRRRRVIRLESQRIPGGVRITREPNRVAVIAQSTPTAVQHRTHPAPGCVTEMQVIQPGQRVKILDLGKLKYANQKKAAEARKNQKVIEIKEIKMRPNIDSHDYEVKMRAVKRFFDEGDKVKLTLRFRGREMAHLELGMQLLTKVREEVAPIAKVEAEPKLEGRQMMMVLAPR